MKFYYNKRDNSKLFSSLEKKDLVNVSKIQNYIPLYNNFFTLNDSNYNNINLDNKFSLYNIYKKETYNKFEGIVISKNSKKENKQIFFKYSPILDPIKYIVGTYDMSNVDLLNLPDFKSKNSHPKVRDINNSAYVDSFFTYITSKLLHEHNFIHGLDFYGSFLGIKHDFPINVIDYVDYINKSEFFHKNNGKLFTLDLSTEKCNSNTRNFKEKLNINDGIIQLSDIKDLTELDNICLLNENIQNNPELIFENIIKIKKISASSSDSCSSRSSNTISDIDSSEDNKNNDQSNESVHNNESDDESVDDESASDDNESASDDNESASDDNESDDNEEEEELIATIANFPVQIISLERCENTLDNLVMKNDISDEEWGSIIMQILMILITLQKKCHLTHNDLHSNNIMYNSTKIKYIYYKLDGKYYKVPTYGRIYKIIDFGRAIYKFRGVLMCSDSYHHKGDASSQYNCEPFFNKNKPRLEPNYSFDLCRLGCSLFDFITDNDCIDKISSPILKIIAGWCKDDKGRNIMYKNNGKERYPDFKLYKMIARTVNNHIPSKVIDNIYFDKYIINKKLTLNQVIMDIDDIPNYTII